MRKVVLAVAQAKRAFFSSRGEAALCAALVLGMALGSRPAEGAPFAHVTNGNDSTVSVIDIATNTAATSKDVHDPRPRDGYGWVLCASNFTPLGDAKAAAFVVRAAENRPGNKAANQYGPSGAELAAFRYGETNLYGQNAVQANPYAKYVTGGYSGTTDQTIQWGAEKWGIPADWLRAVYVNESYWNQTPPGGVCPPPPGGNGCGDLTTVSNSANYPAYSRYGQFQAFQSLGIAQVRWNHPDINDTGIGTEPLRWKSTAFNVDFMAAQVRFYFDNPGGVRSTWGDASYSSCQNWLSIGGWYNPYPWNNPGQQGYVQSIQTILGNRPWTQPGF